VPLAELGLDSILAADLRSRLAARLGVEVPLDRLAAARSIAELEALLRSEGPAAGGRVSWFFFGVPPPGPAAAPRLFCLPYAGGSASAYGRLRRALAPDVEVHGLELPGHGARAGEPPFEDLDELADAVCDAIQPFLGNRAALFGHSFGALLALAVIRRLRQRDQPALAALIVSAAPAPHLFAERSAALAADPDAVLPEVVRRDPELKRQAERMLAADVQAIRSARWDRRSYGVPIAAIAGSEDPVVSARDLEEWRWFAPSFRGPFTVPGKHLYLNEAAGELARIVHGIMAGVDGTPAKKGR